MDVYFIRHGQTDGNTAKRHQHPDTPLNEIGKQQAEAAAAVFADMHITHIITSRQKRAMQTAEQIGAVTGVIPETTDLFEEMYRPEYLIGERRTGWVTWRYMILWYLGYQAASMHDGETYEAFRQRLSIGRKYLESLPINASVVIVSHAAFISFFASYIKREKPISFFQSTCLFIAMLRLKNTAVVHLSFDGVDWHRHHR